METDQSASHTPAHQTTTSLLRMSTADPEESVISTHKHIRSIPGHCRSESEPKPKCFIPQEQYNLEFHRKLWPDFPQTHSPYTFQNQLFLYDHLHLTSHYPVWYPWQKERATVKIIQKAFLWILRGVINKYNKTMEKQLCVPVNNAFGMEKLQATHYFSSIEPGRRSPFNTIALVPFIHHKCPLNQGLSKYPEMY